MVKEGHAWRTFREPRERLIDLPDLPGDGRPAATRLAWVLATAIRDRTFGQGEKLPTAASLSHRFGVSVDTCRVAVNLLVSHGLVRKERGGSAYVRGEPVTPTTGAQAEQAVPGVVPGMPEH